MKPTAILTGDIHLKDTQPICRLDDRWITQINKIKFLSDLQKQYDNIPILDAGDLLDKCKSSPMLEAWAITNLPYIITVPGNHDMPNHNISLFNRSSLAVLEASKAIKVIKDDETISIKCAHIIGYRWGMTDKQYDRKICRGEFIWNRKVAIMHRLVYEDKHLWPGLEAIKGEELLKQYDMYDLIVTGHNHLSFVSEYNGRILVNVGSLFRDHADQINHKPRVYLWYSEKNKIESIYAPIEKDVISREHLENKKRNDSKIYSFVTYLEKQEEVALSFENKLDIFFSNNIILNSIKQRIYSAMGDW